MVFTHLIRIKSKLVRNVGVFLQFYTYMIFPPASQKLCCLCQLSWLTECVHQTIVFDILRNRIQISTENS